MLQKELASGARLIIEIVWGTILFLVIAVTALAAHTALVAMVAWAGATGFIVTLLTAVKYGVLVVDLMCYTVLMVRAAARLIRKEE